MLSSLEIVFLRMDYIFIYHQTGKYHACREADTISKRPDDFILESSVDSVTGGLPAAAHIYIYIIYTNMESKGQSNPSSNRST